eukprot:scaffold721_cov131-Cylindrotheca_fusiformis.AAC.40
MLYALPCPNDQMVEDEDREDSCASPFGCLLCAPAFCAQYYDARGFPLPPMESPSALYPSPALPCLRIGRPTPPRLSVL